MNWGAFCELRRQCQRSEPHGFDDTRTCFCTIGLFGSSRIWLVRSKNRMSNQRINVSNLNRNILKVHCDPYDQIHSFPMPSLTILVCSGLFQENLTNVKGTSNCRVTPHMHLKRNRFDDYGPQSRLSRLYFCSSFRAGGPARGGPALTVPLGPNFDSAPAQHRLPGPPRPTGTTESIAPVPARTCRACCPGPSVKLTLRS